MNSELAEQFMVEGAKLALIFQRGLTKHGPNGIENALRMAADMSGSKEIRGAGKRILDLVLADKNKETEVP